MGLVAIAPTALNALYGHQYAYGSFSFAILSLAEILVAFYWILTTTLTAIGETSAVMQINIISVFSYIALLLVFVPILTDVGAASARFAMQAISIVIAIYLLSARANLKVGVDKESLWKSAIASITIVPTLILVEHVLASLSAHLILVVDIVVGGSVYFLLLYLLKAVSHQDFELLRGAFPSLSKYIGAIERIVVRKA